MIDKETQRKIESCKALQGKTVEDIIKTDLFLKNVAAYLTEQRETRKTARATYEAMKKAGGMGKYKLPAHVCDTFIVMSAEQFRNECLSVIGKTSSRSARERLYVEQLCRQAYNLTVAQIIVEEFPELESVLIPKNEVN